MNEFFKAKQTGQSAKEQSKSTKSRSEGELSVKKYRNYYDISDTITTAQATDPHDEDHQNYDVERVFEALERNAEKLWVANDAAVGGMALFVIVYHEGGQNFARERPIYPQQFKVYYNVYELRLRSATQGHAYRVTEYELGTI